MTITPFDIIILPDGSIQRINKIKDIEDVRYQAMDYMKDHIDLASHQEIEHRR